jgi:hypothetical protein
MTRAAATHAAAAGNKIVMVCISRAAMSEMIDRFFGGTRPTAPKKIW